MTVLRHFNRVDLTVHTDVLVPRKQACSCFSLVHLRYSLNWLQAASCPLKTDLCEKCRNKQFINCCVGNYQPKVPTWIMSHLVWVETGCRSLLSSLLMIQRSYGVHILNLSTLAEFQNIRRMNPFLFKNGGIPVCLFALISWYTSHSFLLWKNVTVTHFSLDRESTVSFFHYSND